jgi:hypothetical protein
MDQGQPFINKPALSHGRASDTKQLPPLKAGVIMQQDEMEAFVGGLSKNHDFVNDDCQ